MVRWNEPVTVLETSDPALLAAAKSLLDTAKIPFFAKGDAVSDLSGLRRMIGFDPVGSPVELQVSVDNAPRARTVLIELTRNVERP